MLPPVCNFTTVVKRLAGHHGTDTAIGKDLQYNGVGDGTVDNMRAINTLLDTLDAAHDLGNHAGNRHSASFRKLWRFIPLGIHDIAFHFHCPTSQ